ncbi:hypothetical protein [Streptomyces shenzhenensis]|uniref:Lipoprotein n=1 Tax=Streptomyces shenzhenensis TaxID=943815 RepID=A0A3M0IFP8_9ACTN|nr:hypothetical protein [Streptomyces shenzhenensis]RMB85613.1 hypothetical protein CTZ28_12535 [Streptomyces shenzhenensis]
MRTRATITLATAAALLALTACSSSDDKASSPTDPAPAKTTTPTPAETGALELTVRDYTEAYFKGDAKTAYGVLSKRCAGKVTEELFAATVRQAHTDYGAGHPATDVQADVSGDLARVTYKVEGLPKFDQESQPWAREGGTWKYDAC